MQVKSTRRKRSGRSGAARTGGTRRKTLRTGKKVSKRKVGGSRKKSKKSRKAKRSSKALSLSSICARGVQFTREDGFDSSATTGALYLGHTTCPMDVFRTQVWCACLKALWKKVGVSVASLDEFLLVNNTDNILIYYQLDPTKGTDILTVSIGLFGTNILAQAAYMSDAIRPWNAGVVGMPAYNQYQNVFSKIEFSPDATVANMHRAPCELNFFNSKIAYYTRSEFKMQNRSVGEPGDDEYTRVDSVPIYATSYVGRGNGPVIRPKSGFGGAGAPITLVGQNASGVIATGSDGDTNEPPRGDQIGAKKVGRTVFAPGTVSTSVLVDKKELKISTIFTKFANYAHIVGVTTTQQFYRHNFGKFRLFGFDKMIETIAKATRRPIRVAAEHNLYSALCFIESHKGETTQTYTFNNAIE